MKKFREVVAARLRYAGASEDDLFRTLRVRDALIMLSGGQPTELMTLVRESIVRGGLPIGREALARAKDEWRQAYVRQLRLDHWPILEEVRRTGHVTRTLDNDAPFRELLDSRAILLYRNREEWYGLHPAIADLRPPATAARKRRA